MKTTDWKIADQLKERRRRLYTTKKKEDHDASPPDDDHDDDEEEIRAESETGLLVSERERRNGTKRETN